MAKLTKDYFGSADTGEPVRINKYLSDAGICSRREADELIAAGKVLIDEVPAVMGSKVMSGQKITVSGKEVCKDERMVLIAFNKPQGIVCTADRREPDNIVDYINYGSRIFPIGRLDKGSEGLILLTNDGEIVNKILRAGNGHEKEYIVQVNKPLTAEFLKGMAGGVPILDTVTKPCLVEQLDKTTFRVVLTQGLNRQIRRMCEYFDYRVRALQRVRIMNISLGRLKTGTWRNLTEWELEEMNQLLETSSNEPAAKAGKTACGNLPPEGIVIVKQTAEKNVRKRHFEKKRAKETEHRGFSPKERAKGRAKETERRGFSPKERARERAEETERRGFSPKERAKGRVKETERRGFSPKERAKERPWSVERKDTLPRERSERPKTGVKGVGWTKKREDVGKKGWQAAASKNGGRKRENKDGAAWKKRRKGSES